MGDGNATNGLSGILGKVVGDSGRIKARLDLITEQTATGLVAQTYGGLGAASQISLDLRPQLSAIDAINQNIASAKTKNDLTSQVIVQLQQIASNFFSGTIGMAVQTSQEIDTMASQASGALDQVQGLLNTKVGDGYLFAGEDIGNAPMPSSPFSAYVQSIKSATANLGTNGGPATAAATLAAATATSPFAATLAAKRQLVTVGFGVSAQVGIVAGSNAFAIQTGASTTGSYVRDLVRSLATIASLNSSQASFGGAFSSLVDDTRNSLGKQIIALTQENAGLGVSSQILASNQASIVDTQQVLIKQISGVEEVDAASTAAALSETQTQLQMSYKIIASMQNLSLSLEIALMTTLVLELRQGEFMVVNGAPIRFRTKARIELAAHARFLFGKQIMGPDEADSPAKRIYFALQTSYIGADEERPGGLALAETLINEFRAATTSVLAREILGRAWLAAETDDCYKALKLVRRIMRHEDAVLGNTV
eukprot:gene9700-9764_t